MSQFTSNLRQLFLRNERISSFSLGGSMLVIIAAIGIVTLTSLTDQATKGYELQRLQAEHEELVSDGEVTEMLTLRARSISSVEEQTPYMIKPERENITYVLPVSVVASQDKRFE